MTVTASGVKGAFVKSVRVKKVKGGFRLSSTFKLPARMAGAKRLKVRITGKGVRTVTRTITVSGKGKGGKKGVFVARRTLRQG